MDEQYRVVRDSTGGASSGSSVASAPLSKTAANARFDSDLDTFESDIRDGNVRVLVLAETEFWKRGQ
jgi:hypothetical protein